MFDITRRYRTIHSLRDHEVEAVLKHFPGDARSALDFGCHLGHLSFELAIRHDVTIYAVDNFTGTLGDDLMAKTVHTLTKGSMDFYETFVANMHEAERLAGGFKGRIIPLRTTEFFDRAAREELELDFAFIDSSHRAEEADEFVQIARLVKPGAILGGHDYDQSVYNVGVVKGIKMIEHDFQWLSPAYTWFMKKRGQAASCQARSAVHAA